MQKVLRKVMLSTLITLMLIVTFGTITFAWVGINSTSRFEPFDITLDAVDLNETSDMFKQAYGLEISLTGKKGSFTTSIDQTELKRHILYNYYGKNNDYLNDTIKSNQVIINEFNALILDQATLDTTNFNSTDKTYYNANKTGLEFKNIDGDPTTKVFKFDLYVSVYKVFEPSEDVSDNLDVYLTGNILKGTNRSVGTIFDYTYPTSYEKAYSALGISEGNEYTNSGTNAILPGTTISGVKTVNSASSARIAFTKYKIVDKYHPEYYLPEYYLSNDEIKKCYIYQGGTKYPTVENDIYSFGGILEDEVNFALYNYNKKHPDDVRAIPENVLYRKDIDIEYKATDLNQLVDSTTEKISESKMIKMTIYFWFEGWDADCFDVIDRSPVSINIGLTAYKKSN